MSQPDGWLTGEEAAELRRLAEGLTVLELGAWQGRSTVALAETAAYVVSVDRHRGIEGRGGDSLAKFLDNLRGLPNVAVVIGEFGEVGQHLHGFDMVYIDGDHDAAAVAADTDTAAGAVVDGGIVAYHDWDFDEVRETVITTVGRGPDGVAGSVAHYTASRP